MITTVHDHLTARAAQHGERRFLHSLGQDRAVSYAELDRATNRLCWHLDELGVGPDDRVSVLAENTLESVLAYLGVQRHGAVVNPVNTSVNAANAPQILREVRPRVVIARRSLEIDEEVRQAAGTATWIEYDDLDSAAAGGSAADRWLPGLPDHAWRGPAGDGSAPAIISHTSGTSAAPKGVVHSRSSLHHSTVASVELVGMTDADRVLEFRDISWLSAQVLTLAASVATGASVFLAPSFSRSQFLPWLTDHEITVAVGVPSAINMLLAEVDDGPALGLDLPALRFMTSSTAPLPVDRQREFEAHFGIEILQFMGMSEAGWIAGNRPGHRKVGTVGPAGPYQHVRTVDPDGREVPAGTEGEIVVGGEQLALGYLLGGEVVPLDDRDRFPTGDLGMLDEDGYLTVTGRKKDLIIRGGVNIAPLEVSAAVASHPAVDEAATIGVPDPIYGEEIASFVTLRAPVSEEELIDHARSRLSDFKAPRSITTVDALPVNSRGKLDPEALRAVFEGGRAAPGSNASSLRAGPPPEPSRH